MNSFSKGLLEITMVVSLLVSSCARYPQDEIDRAIFVLDSLQRLDNYYSLNPEFVMLEDSLMQILESIEKDKSGFSPKDYDKKSLELEKLTERLIDLNALLPENAMNGRND